MRKGPPSNQETTPKNTNRPTRVTKGDSGDLPKGGKLQIEGTHKSWLTSSITHVLNDIYSCPKCINSYSIWWSIYATL